ncbi:MAG: GNAT family N-acetyltransferase [Oscillospiraceae bacterium]|nr:GNAT family N-acetyltransferase [Oscillospiraceae bacterium]
MTLETKRLLLRPYEAGDWVDYVAYFNDPEMWRMMGYRPFEREEDFRGDFQWRLENPGVTALVLKESGHVVGHICAGELNPPLLEREELREKQGVSLSFSLHRALRRQGLMREALEAMLDELFCSRRVDFVNSGYFSFNEASAGLHRSLGFRPLFSHAIERNGETIEVIETILERDNDA